MAEKERKESIEGSNKNRCFVVSATMKKVFGFVILSLTILLAMTYGMSHVVSMTRMSRETSDVTADDAEIYEHAAVAADAVTCSEIGAEVLRKNGSVVDAGIASCFCLGVINMHSSGLGGGGLMLVYIRENKTFEAFDYRERAPIAATPEFFKDRYNLTLRGPLSIAVPGEIKGLHAAWKKYGKLPWRDLIEPTINMTEYGFQIQLRLYESMQNFRYIIEEDEGLIKLLTTNGTLNELGSTLKMPLVTRTLRRIQDDPEDFYTGLIAKEIVEDMHDIGAIITAEDLANFKVKNREILKLQVGNYTLSSLTGPFGGPIVFQIMNILKGYNLTADDIADDEKKIKTYHRIAEAFKYAYSQRTKEGDPDFLEKGHMEKLYFNATSDVVGEYFRSKIADTETYGVGHYGPELSQPMEEGTTHVSLIAPNGDAVAITNTINEWFGAGFRSRRNGIIYNNEMNDFAIPGGNLDGFPASPYNFLAPGKIPLSSSTPLIITDQNGDVKMVLGSSGGTRIITAIAFVIINKLWFGEELGHAVSTPRFYHQLVPNQITFEENFPVSDTIAQGLKKLGHKIFINPRPEYSAVQAIYVENKHRIFAKSDPRKYGHTAGF